MKKKKRSEIFSPGRERRQGRRPSCPTWWSECEKGEGGKDADMIVEVNVTRDTRQTLAPSFVATASKQDTLNDFKDSHIYLSFGAGAIFLWAMSISYLCSGKNKVRQTRATGARQDTWSLCLLEALFTGASPNSTGASPDPTGGLRDSAGLLLSFPRLHWSYSRLHLSFSWLHWSFSRLHWRLSRLHQSVSRPEAQKPKTFRKATFHAQSFSR